ncbi:IS200/IS605 family transposase [Pedobacter sp. SD-b]|uniref:IS200/IS605 family transposase n=1 Tax=Pedobacter segetis TaxID=2793069 RepID=A0ABS1BMQ8_9SPHI|nr:IS200/IS605 family transposase [Pedobacter segetis]MBK0384184.1 IS200/IS605 family transposase [Pedobacter segetis]
MANTYSQITIHCVFAVKGRKNFIDINFRDELHKYMSGIMKNIGAFPLAIGGWSDHVHVLFELNPNTKVSDLMRELKANSSKWINEKNFLKEKFNWQEGYGAFSYSRSQRNNVINYILNQEQHHSKKTFKDEYLEFLEKFEIEFKNEYLFEFYD